MSDERVPDSPRDKRGDVANAQSVKVDAVAVPARDPEEVVTNPLVTGTDTRPQVGVLNDSAPGLRVNDAIREAEFESQREAAAKAVADRDERSADESRHSPTGPTAPQAVQVPATSGNVQGVEVTDGDPSSRTQSRAVPTGDDALSVPQPEDLVAREELHAVPLSKGVDSPDDFVPERDGQPDTPQQDVAADEEHEDRQEVNQEVVNDEFDVVEVERPEDSPTVQQNEEEYEEFTGARDERAAENAEPGGSALSGDATKKDAQSAEKAREES